MAINTYNSPQDRITIFKADIIKFTAFNEVLTKVGRQVKMPMKNSKTYMARTYIPYGAGATKGTRNTRFPTDASQAGIDRSAAILTAHRSTDGVTSSSDAIQTLDFSATIQTFECSYSFSRETVDFSSEDIPENLKMIVADRVSMVNEMVVWTGLRACTNVFYAGTGTSIATVNGAVTLPMLRRIAKSLMGNNAKPVGKLLKAGPNVNTTPVAQAFFVYIHTDQISDFRVLGGALNDSTKFFPAENYPETAMPGEIGKVEGFRIIASPFWPPLMNAGALVGSTGCVASNGGANIDVYPFIVMAEDAFSQIAMRGMDAVDPTYIPANQKTKSDIHGKRGYVGAYWYKGIFIENDGWMAVGYAGNLVI